MRRPPINYDVFMPLPVKEGDNLFYPGYVCARPVMSVLLSVEPGQENDWTPGQEATIKAAEELLQAAIRRRVGVEPEAESQPPPTDVVNVAAYVRAQWT